MNILETADELVPKGIPWHIRDDIVQDVAVALLDGSLPKDDTTALKRIIRHVYKESVLGFGHPRSLDKPSPITGKSIYETQELHLVPKFITPKEASERRWRLAHRGEYLIYLRNYYQKYREELRISKRRHYQEHKEERCASQHRYALAHREEKCAYMRKYRQEHKEQRRIYDRKHYRERHGKC